MRTRKVKQLTIEVYGNTRQEALDALTQNMHNIRESQNDFSSYSDGSGYMFEWGEVDKELEEGQRDDGTFPEDDEKEGEDQDE